MQSVDMMPETKAFASKSFQIYNKIFVNICSLSTQANEISSIISYTCVYILCIICYIYYVLYIIYIIYIYIIYIYIYIFIYIYMCQPEMIFILSIDQPKLFLGSTCRVTFILYWNWPR